MSEIKYATVDILRDATVNGTLYTPQTRIVPASVASELVAQKAAVLITPNKTDDEILAAESKAIAAADKATK